MPLFRRKTDSSLPRTSSLSVYGQGRAQVLLSAKNADKLSDSSSLSSKIMDDRPQPFLAFAEATYDPSVPMNTKSRLSKDLLEVLGDNAALAYFIQFMDANKAKHLVKFWMEAESFRISSSEARRKAPAQKCPDPSLCNATIPSSGSSGCVSVKSDELCQGSSHNASSKLDLEGTCDINLKGVETGVCNSNSDKHSPERNRTGTIHLDTVCEEIKEVSLKDTTQNSSTDSVLDGEENSPSHSRSEGCDDDKTVSVDDSQKDDFTVVNSVQDGVDSKVPFKEWARDAIRYFSGEEPSVDQLRDGCNRVETSIEQNANFLYSKYIAQDAPFSIGISCELMSAISDDIFKAAGIIDSNCFVLAQEFVLKRMDKEYFSSFLRSSFHCKHQIDVLTSGNVFLADVLYNESALFFFMEFVEQEGVRHLVDFLLTADNFQKQLISQGSYDGVQAQVDAMVLYEKYFSLQATTPLGFSDSVRYEVEANICREEGPLPDCFIKPVKILTQYLEKTYLLQFLNSQLYFKYISECIIIIQSEGTDVAAGPKYTASDSGSEQSLPISTVNTLLAMDSKQPGASKVIRNVADDQHNMRIDTAHFKPDALWQRPLAGKLQMAHVDHLGRVISEFEPEPDRRRESRISKAVKKLVNWEEDKNQEDMAWKVAEMIVKDICSVTMPESGSPVPGRRSTSS